MKRTNLSTPHLQIPDTNFSKMHLMTVRNIVDLWMFNTSTIVSKIQIPLLETALPLRQVPQTAVALDECSRLPPRSQQHGFRSQPYHPSATENSSLANPFPNNEKKQTQPPRYRNTTTRTCTYTGNCLAPQTQNCIYVIHWPAELSEDPTARDPDASGSGSAPRHRPRPLTELVPTYESRSTFIVNLKCVITLVRPPSFCRPSCYCITCRFFWKYYATANMRYTPGYVINQGKIWRNLIYLRIAITSSVQHKPKAFPYIILCALILTSCSHTLSQRFRLVPVDLSGLGK